MCFSCSCFKMNIVSEHTLFFRNPNWFSLRCGSTIYPILFSSILANTLLGCDIRLISLYWEHSLLSHLRFHIGIMMDCLHSIGAIPYFQTALHTLHSRPTPASPAAFIISMHIPSISGAFPVFVDFSDSSASDRSISGSCSRMSCAEKLLSLVSSFGFSNPSK